MTQITLPRPVLMAIIGAAHHPRYGRIVEQTCCEIGLQTGIIELATRVQQWVDDLKAMNQVVAAKHPFASEYAVMEPLGHWIIAELSAPHNSHLDLEGIGGAVDMPISLDDALDHARKLVTEATGIKFLDQLMFSEPER